MRWSHRDPTSLTSAVAVSSDPVRRVVACTLIAAGRERVWEEVYSWRNLLPFASKPTHARREQAHDADTSGGTVVPRRWRRMGLNARPELVMCSPPVWYAYRLNCGPLFRAFSGRVELREYQCSTTEVIWTVEFRPTLPGTGWLAGVIIDRLLDSSLLHLKQALEVVHPPRS